MGAPRGVHKRSFIKMVELVCEWQIFKGVEFGYLETPSRIYGNTQYVSIEGVNTPLVESSVKIGPVKNNMCIHFFSSAVKNTDVGLGCIINHLK